MVYEKKTVINDELMEKLVSFFDKESSKKETENQVIYNYHTEGDLRLIKTKDYTKLDFKPNKANEKESKVFINNKYSKDLEEIFTKIGMNIEIKRYRQRHMYIYDGMYISIDKTIKTGNIFRVKFESVDEKTFNEKVLNLFEKFEIPDTKLEKFGEMYARYRTDWADLTKDINEEEFLK